jgi:uncharacterized BrkB/YihY/UPF0761 family membrane protein
MINEVKEWSLFIAALLSLCRRFLDIKWIGIIGGIFFGIFVIITFYQMCAKYKNEKKIKPLFKTFWIDLIIIFPPITIIVLLVFFLLERCA